MIDIACAFTGHRPKSFPWGYNENDNRCIALKAMIAQQISNLAADGVADFYSGMALGVDTWAAAAVLDLRKDNSTIRLHCILPCKGQECKWTIPAQERYKSILQKADSIKYVKQIYDKKCMLERNHQLVDSATILLAVYNGSKRCGTAATIRYAQKTGRAIIIIDPVTQSVSHNDISLPSILL